MKKVLIAISEPVLERGYQVLLEAGFFSTETCSSAEDLYERFLSSPPPMALIDWRLLPGLDYLADLRNAAPQSQILLCCGPAIAELRVGLAELGTPEVIPRNVSAKEFLITTWLLAAEAPGRLNAAALRMRNSGPDELRLLDLISGGLTDREIGAIVHLPDHTVRATVRQMVSRFGMKDRAELALHAWTALENWRTDYGETESPSFAYAASLPRRVRRTTRSGRVEADPKHQ